MVSFIISTYNGAKFLEKTIQSALMQEDVEVEVIIIDDCSKDNSYEIAQNYEKEDIRVHSFINDKNQGFCKNVNQGLSKAKGEYVLVIGQDDMLEKNHCATMLSYFKQENDVAVFCDYKLIDEDDTVFDTTDHCPHKDLTIKNFLKFNVMPSCGLIMKTEALKKVGGYPENPDFPHYGEYSTWIRLAQQGNLRFCNSIRSFYRRHSTNMTNDFQTKATKKKLRKYYNTCRRQAIDAKGLSIKDKIKLRGIIVLETLRSI